MRVSNWLCLAVLLSAIAAPAVQAQLPSARRMGMGGVTLLRGGSGGGAVNVAYRAVPPPQTKSPGGFPLPIGLIPLLNDPPTFDTNDSSFNAFRLANLALHPPWNYPLVEADEPAGDIAISVGRNALTVDLGSLRDVIPDERIRFASLARGPAFMVGIRQAFIGLAPLVEMRNEFDLNDALRSALHDGQPFQPNTEYSFTDRAHGQAAAQAVLGTAFPLMRADGADDRGGLYVGARAKLLRGIAYGDADENVGFVTSDTLFGDQPMDTKYMGRVRTAEPSGGGWGNGFDLGAVYVSDAFEVGLAANDLGERIRWHVKETVTAKDTVTGEYRTVTVGEDLPFTSDVPANFLLTATTRVGPALLAADVRRDGLQQITGHAGVEFWAGQLALRAGTSLDSQQNVQVAGGVGLRFGRIGLDLGVATNQANLTRERAVDLGAGIAFYPRSH